MTAAVVSKVNWIGSQDQDGHREYRVTWLVRCTSASDGPHVAATAASLPAIGASWSYGNDSDAYALCWPTIKATQLYEKEKNYYWHVENLFSTKPLNRCQTTSITNPLAEPDRISGSFVNYTKMTIRDYNGLIIMSSSLQSIPVEIDDHRATVNIDQNVTDLELEVVTEMINTLNDSTLWGLAARKIKLSRFSWERKLYGVCTYYYTRRLGFDINFKGFDRDDIVDKGDRRLKGDWDNSDPPVWIEKAGLDRTNPNHYVKIIDTHGNVMGNMPLNGAGEPNPDPVGSPVYITDPLDDGSIKLYGESDFTQLGVPITL